MTTALEPVESTEPLSELSKRIAALSAAEFDALRQALSLLHGVEAAVATVLKAFA